jgi:hypothetical protein
MNWEKKTACMAIKIDAAHASEVWQKLQSWSPALGAWETTGDWDYLVWLDVADIDTLHNWAMEVRGWSGVSHTASHLVWKGAKNGKGWWEEPASAWVWGRWEGAENEKDPVEEGWATGAFSIPGDWDSLFWVQGKDWDELWSNTRNLRQQGWATSIQVPMRSWWNQDKLNSWA